jgi:hypothetical protein
MRRTNRREASHEPASSKPPAMKCVAVHEARDHATSGGRSPGRAVQVRLELGVVPDRQHLALAMVIDVGVS